MAMRIITITGASGVGKDTVARILSEMTGFPMLCSYTTRPMREGEVDGREHRFVSKCCTDRKDMLAYTVYGGHQYWTEVSQVTGTVIYVIDEEGLRDLRARFPQIALFTVGVYADMQIRQARGVTEDRMVRDQERTLYDAHCYDYVIYNNGTLQDLHNQASIITQMLASESLHG